MTTTIESLESRVRDWLTSLNVAHDLVEIPVVPDESVRLPAVDKRADNKSASLLMGASAYFYYDFVTTFKAFFPFQELPDDEEVQQSRQARAEYYIQKRKDADESAEQVAKRYYELVPHALGVNAYAAAKGLDASKCYDVKSAANVKNLYVPFYNADGELRAVETIYLDQKTRKWEKRSWEPGAAWHGLMHFHAPPRITSKFIIVEGWATGASLQKMLTNSGMVDKETVCVVSAKSASNIVAVVEQLLMHRQDQSIILAPDNDKNGVGLKAIESLKDKFKVMLPHMTAEQAENKNCTKVDWNDFYVANKDNPNNIQQFVVGPYLRILEALKPLATIHTVDVAAGGGKTTEMVRQIKDSPNRVVLYVAPIVTLLDQTEEEISKACPDLTIVNTSLVAMKEKGIKGRVRDYALASIEAAVNSGQGIVLITHTTFLAIAGGIQPKTKSKLHVYADEAFTALDYFELDFGKTEESIERGLTTLNHYVRIDGQGILSLQVGIDAENLSWEDAGFMSNLFTNAAKEYISDPWIICESFPSERFKRYLLNKGKWTAPQEDATSFSDFDPDNGKRLSLSVGCYVDPRAFKGFKTFTMMAAQFKETPLAMLWRSLGVKLVDDGSFKNLIDTHITAGPRIDFYYCLPSASIGELKKVLVESKPKFAGAVAERELTVMDRILLGVDAFMPGPYLLQTNNHWNENRHSNKDLSDRVEWIPMMSQGSNEWKSFNNIAALGVMNLNPDQCAWWEKRTDLPRKIVQAAHRYHPVYQAMCRTSIRVRDAKDPIVVVVVGEADCKALSKTFKGSRVVGVVPGLEDLYNGKEMRGETEPYKDAEYKRHGKDISAFLNTTYPTSDTVGTEEVMQGLGLTTKQVQRASNSVTGWTRPANKHYFKRIVPTGF